MNDLPWLIFRAVLATFISFTMAIIIFQWIVPYLKQKKLGQPVSTYIPGHLSKQGTPIVGGVVIAIASICAILGILKMTDPILIVLGGSFLFAILGGIDDWSKIRENTNKGLSAQIKYLVQSLWAILILIWVTKVIPHPAIFVPLKGVIEIPSWLFLGLGYFMIVGTSNALNLTDGLDGLAARSALPIVFALSCLSLFPRIYHWTMPYLEGGHELVILGGALLGGLSAFLCFNAYPASVFLGDFGALWLGALLGIWAVLLGQPILFFILSCLLVVETLSTILQVSVLRLSGRRFRVFKIAPLHHHFEKSGYHENIVTTRFSIVAYLGILLVIILLCF